MVTVWRNRLVTADKSYKEAEKKLNAWTFRPKIKYGKAAALFKEAADNYYQAKSWDQAKNAYRKLAHCYSKLGKEHDADKANDDADQCIQNAGAPYEEQTVQESQLKATLCFCFK